MKMNSKITENISNLPEDPRAASKTLLDKILNEIHPLVIKIRNRSHSWLDEGSSSNIRNVYTLCLCQIKKCVLNLFEIFGHEFSSQLCLQETRHCNLERLSWCLNRLISLDKYLEKKSENGAYNDDDTADNSFDITVMYFVNWIDHAFETLGKLSELVYKTDYKESVELYETWKSDMMECVTGLHLSIDELLLSAMTLYRYCLPNDQLIVKARCQVVLRETKALLSELIEGDPSNAAKSTEALKLPVMPTNINVMIDVLKDVLYVLETNTNTALLTLLVHCCSGNTSAVDILKQHFMEGSKSMCSCLTKSTDDVTEDCQFVKDFDLYNERLLQIGSFAVSCSSDQQRILTLRSGLASLEALEPALVPALATSPGSYHSALLLKSWRQEVAQITHSVFLIVDPAAFADKSKQMLHQKLLDVLKQTSYNNAGVCAVINIGCVVQDFFDVYNEMEPLALPHRDKLMPLLADLNKVILECKVVSNLLCTNVDFAYDVKTPTEKEATLDRLYKRLKLLHTLVVKINTLLQPKDQLFDDEVQIQNVTHTIVKNDQTYSNSQQKKNLSRSIFARTNIRSSTRNFPLSKLTKHLRGKNCSQLNFSIELDRLFNLSSENGSGNGTFVKNKVFDKVRERSVLYNFSPIKNRSSMRKVVLNRQLKSIDKIVMDTGSHTIEKQSVMDETESLQLTDVLNQMNDTTNMLTNITNNKCNIFSQTQTIQAPTKGVLRLKVNQKTDNSKDIWNIPVNCSSENESLLTSNISNLTQPSYITTMERIQDLDLLETKLNSLKSQFETSL